MNVNALQSPGSAYAPTSGANSTSNQRTNSPSASDAAAASAVALQSTQVTLSASANLNFYDIPSSLGLNLSQNNNPWTVPALQSGSAAPSGSTLLGQFAENELANELSSPNALAGATVTINSFSTQSTNTASVGQEVVNGQGGTQSATVSQASNSVSLQGSGDITLADGEVIPFTAELDTSASIVETSATQTTSGTASDTTAPATSAASSTPSGLNSGSLNQASNLPDSTGAQPASNSTAPSVASEWASMLQQYKLLLNLFDTVNKAVQDSQSSPLGPVGAAANSATSSTPASAANSVASTGSVPS